jgi:hypothetical protein
MVAFIQTCEHSVKFIKLGEVGAGKKISYGPAITSWRTDRFPPVWELRDFAHCYMTSIVKPFFECHVHQESNLPSHYNNKANCE